MENKKGKIIRKTLYLIIIIVVFTGEILVVKNFIETRRTINERNLQIKKWSLPVPYGGNEDSTKWNMPELHGED